MPRARGTGWRGGNRVLDRSARPARRRSATPALRRRFQAQSRLLDATPHNVRAKRLAQRVRIERVYQLERRAHRPIRPPRDVRLTHERTIARQGSEIIFCYRLRHARPAATAAAAKFPPIKLATSSRARALRPGDRSVAGSSDADSAGARARSREDVSRRASALAVDERAPRDQLVEQADEEERVAFAAQVNGCARSPSQVRRPRPAGNAA